VGKAVSSAAQRSRVLLVDDDAFTRRATAAAIERRLGLDVVAARGAMEALTMLRKETFDVLVLDIDMPEMNGLELLGRLAKLFPDLAVGVWSGSVSASEITGANVRFAIQKPEMEKLFAALREVLGIERASGEIPLRGPKRI
jgi:CheY-like chemotaxis protein